MDSSSLKIYKRRRNLNNMKDINDKGRRLGAPPSTKKRKKGRSLSELPESVLSHILSFLPLKEAVRTSILSKRWEYIWTSIPKLHFVLGDSLMDFINIVNRSLQLRGSFDITSFSLHCGPIDLYHDYEGSDVFSEIEEWISNVVRFNVQNVELNFAADSTLTLPLSFVNCRTLTSLTISAEAIYLRFPSSVCFSNLKKLEFIYVWLPDEHSTQKLFSGCHVLEELKLKMCNWGSVNAALSVLSPRLRRFTMIDDRELWFKNFEGPEFVIFGGGLEYFHYEGEFLFDFNILNSQLLEEVRIYFYSHVYEEEDPILVKDRFLKLLRNASNARSLRLMDASRLLVIPEVSIHMPMFNGVQCLELDYESFDLSNRGLLKMLQNMPCLESLKFLQGIMMPSHPIEDNILNPLPPCFLSHLHFIHVFIKKGYGKDLMGVKVLLKSAMVLKEMVIEFSEHVWEDTSNNFCIELLKLPRGSRDCGIIVKN